MTKTFSTDKVHNLCLLSVDEAETFAKSSGIKGIYVWGYVADGQFVPLYVGKSRNVYERIIQHYCRFNGGEYVIPDVVFKDKAPSEPYSIDTSKCFIPTSLKAIFEMLNNREGNFTQNRLHILSNFRFTFLKLDDKIERELAEKYVSDKVGKERLISSVPLLDDIPDTQLQKKLDTAFSQYYKTNLDQN
jgi:hypothetical protein